MNVKVMNRSGNELPQYATALAAGMDVRAANEEPIVIAPLQRVMVPTGLYVEIPAGYEIQVRPRSGLAAKKGVTVLNSPGTIDADYRGEICVILVNLSSEEFVIEKGSASPSSCLRAMSASSGRRAAAFLIPGAVRAASAAPESSRSLIDSIAVLLLRGRLFSPHEGADRFGNAR